MGDLLSRAALAPIAYIKNIQGIKVGDITMKGTSMYPAFPLSALASILSIIGLATYMIVYFFSVDSSETCFSHITYGIIALALVYPL